MVYSKNKKYDNIELAIEESIDECIDSNILTEFLTMHKAEVNDMLLEEYDQQKHFDTLREEGRQEGQIDAIKKLLESLSPEEVIDLGFDEKLVDKALDD